MKKNFIMGLLLLAVFGFTLQSCRNDLLPEHQETYSNSSQFKLTTKTIPLSQSKHKGLIGAALEKAQNNLRKTKIKSSGKILDYENGISIDTDHVVYIENGPDYHTYTFNIIRENAGEGSPIENLVLSPLTDGTYRELLVTYTLSAQEKTDLISRKGVDPKGKVSITEITGGIFNGNGELAKTQSCGWVEQTVFLDCSEHQHGAWNVGDWGGCTAETPPVAYTTVHYLCNSVDGGGSSGGGGVGDVPGYPGNPGDGGGGGGGYDGGGFNPTEPCNGNGVLTGPQHLNNDLGDTGSPCSNIPTTPNPGGGSNSGDPCQKTKTYITNANTLLHNNDVKTKMDAILRGKTKALNEWSVALGKKPNGIEVTNPVEGIPGQNSVATPVSQLQNPFIGDGHSHKGARGNPSGGDLYDMLKGLLTQTDFKYRFVYGNNSNNDTPEVYALVVDNPTLATNFLSQYPESENCNNTNEDHTIKKGSPVGKEFYKAYQHYSEGRSDDTSAENYEPRAVAMAYILEKFNVGMSIANVDANGNLKKINAKVEQITVPSSGGAVKEGVTVSKCP